MTLRYLHTMVRVKDLDKSMAFFRLLGLEETKRMENEEGRFTLVFMAPPGQEDTPVELTYNWGVDSYELGTAYGHIALEVDNAAEACERIRSNGGNVTREAGPVKGGTTVIAFVEDPDGYKIELIEEKDAGRGLGD